MLSRVRTRQAQAEKLGVDISAAQIVDPTQSASLMTQYAEDLVEARKKKVCCSPGSHWTVCDTDCYIAGVRLNLRGSEPLIAAKSV